MSETTFTRRDALKITAFGSAALALPLTVGLQAKQVSRLPDSRMPRPFAATYRQPPVKTPVAGNTYQVVQKPFGANIIPGFTTAMWGYDGMFPGPTFKVERNQPITVRMINELPAVHPVRRYVPATSTHLHGHPSLPQYDGYANDLTPPQHYKDYEWENIPAGRTLWYHDHAVHHTSENLYMGLAGMYLLHDPAEDALGLPSGDFDLPVILSDVAFDERGQLLYDNNSESSLFGDINLVNGVPWPVLSVQPRRYRLRILNASQSRGYRLRLSNGAPLTVVATDGGLTRNPQPVSELRISMGERYEVVVDFTGLANARVELRNLGVDNAVDYDHTNKVMRFEVTAPLVGTDTSRVPDVLDGGSPFWNIRESDATEKRKLVFERHNGLWTINGNVWAEVEKSEFRKVIADPDLHSTEIWTLENKSGGWFHPIHLHLVDFLVLDRNGMPPPPYERGPKDVVYLKENETIRLLVTFEHHSGRYMLHCHNPVHEDHDMMYQFRVEGPADPDPIRSAPAQPLPAPPLV